MLVILLVTKDRKIKKKRNFILLLFLI